MIRLRYERLARGLTQPALSYLTKVPQPVISLIETGKWNPTADDLDALAKVLGITPASALLKPIEIVEEQRA